MKAIQVIFYFFLLHSGFGQNYKIEYGDIKYMFSDEELKQNIQLIDFDQDPCASCKVNMYMLRDTLPDGHYLVFDKNDTARIIISGTYKNKVKNGVFMKYFYSAGARRIENGTIINFTSLDFTIEETYRNGSRCTRKKIKGKNVCVPINRVETSWSSEDSVKYVQIRDSSCNNFECEIAPFEYYYDKNGNLTREEIHFPDKGYNKEVFYKYENGKLVSREVYKNGKLVGRKKNNEL